MKFSTITLTAIAVFVGSQAIAQTNTISSVSIGTQVTAGGTALGVGTVTPRIGTAGNQAGSVQNNLAGLQYVAGQIPLDGSPASIAFFALTGTAIPAGGDTLTGFISYGTLVFPTQVNVYNDLGSKLKSLSYSALTFASDDLGFGASNFYAIHHAPNSVDYIAAIVPGTGTSTSIADLKPMSWAGGTAGGPASAGSNGYFALAYGSGGAITGYAANSMYYLRTDSSSHTQFGMMIPALTGASSDVFDLTTAVGSFGVGGYTTLAYTVTDIGYGANQFYYLRQDLVTGNTILGRLNPSKAAGSRVISDMVNLGGVFNSLTFVPDATGTGVGWGSSQFFASGALAAGAQSVSFEAIPNHNVGDVFTVTPTASSGLDIALTVVSGPASVTTTGSPGFNPSQLIFTVTTTGPGIVTLQASQAGRLAAPAFNANNLQQSFDVLGLPTITSATSAPGTVGTAFTYDITATGSPTSYTASPLPAGLVLNSSTGAITGTPTAAGVTAVVLTATNPTGTSSPVTVTTTIAVAGIVPVINSATAAPGTVGTAFTTYTITATGSPTSYTASPLPAGLVLNSSTGAITGTPTAAAVTVVSLTATNAIGTSSPATVTITIAAAGIAPVITSATTAPGTVGTVFTTYTITATGTPTSFTASPLPAGLVLNSSTGAITGTPTAAAVTVVSLTATNAIGTSSPATVTITIAAAGIAPVITSATTAPGTVGTVFTTYTITATGSPTSFTASPLPAGLVLNSSTGAITGTPTAAGITSVVLTATNATGTSSPVTVTTTIAAAGLAPAINSATTAPGTVGTAFTYGITATGSPTSFTAGPLPAGLVLNSLTGAITGTPTAAGVTGVVLTATNATGTSSPVTVTTTIAAAGLAPVVNSATSAPGTVGTVFATYLITATGSPTSYAASPLPAGLVLNSLTGAITGTPTAAGVTAVMVSATNSIGTSSAVTVNITIAAVGLAPVITSTTSGYYPGTVGMPFPTYTIAATGSPTSFSVTGIPPGLVLNPLTGAITGTPTAAGTYPLTATATNSFGSGTSVFAIAIYAAVVVPVITSPTSAPGTVGTAINTFPITATGVPTSYTATGLPPGLTIDPVTGAITGTPTAAGTFVATITATNSAGSSSVTMTWVIAPFGYSHIVNFSARALSGLGSDTLIVGFVVQGDGKNLLIRGIGPDLAAFGITNFLPAPILTLFSATDSIIATDSGWQVNSSGQNDGALIAATSASVGAFALPSGSLDSALLVTVNNGVHTTGLLTTNATAGVGLIEIYDTGGNQYASLINVSARMNVTAGDGVLIAGLVIGGNLPKTVLVRGVGPALSEFGVGGVLADPQITVFSGSTQIASNAGWSNGTGISAAAQIVSASSQVGAFPLPSGSKDAALLVTLQPGAYTVQVTSVSNATGVALVEVYDTQR